MTNARDSKRRATSFGTAVVLLAIAVAVPLAEKSDIGTAPGLARGHGPASCPSSHDHTLCLQIENTASPSIPVTRLDTHHVLLQGRSGPRRSDGPTVSWSRSHPSRAPPAT